MKFPKIILADFQVVVILISCRSDGWWWHNENHEDDYDNYLGMILNEMLKAFTEDLSI